MGMSRCKSGEKPQQECLNDEGWTTVKSSDKKRVMRKPGVRRRRQSADDIVSSVSDLVEGIADHEVLHKCLLDCKEYVLENTHLWKKLVEALETSSLSLSSSGKRCIVAYGIGNFSKTTTSYYSAPLWQLAITLCIRDYWTEITADSPSNNDIKGKVNLQFFDPCSTEGEISFLQTERLDCQVLTSNSRGIHSIGDDEDEDISHSTLFFMPHCPVQLYENVVWSNYVDITKQRIMFIGNSLRDLAEKKEQDEDGLTGQMCCPCLHALLPWLQETKLVASATDIREAPGNLLGAINDTYLSYYYAADINDWPARPYETRSNINDPELM